MSNSQAPDNRDQGASFEDVFYKQAQLQGFLILKNHTTCRFIPGGRAIVIREGELDFKLITNEGRTGFFDCKCFQGDSFTYSMLDEKQIERSLLYSEWNIPSGFIVYFMKTNKVYLFRGDHIYGKGPRSRFDHADGKLLGTIFQFKINHVMKL